MKIRLMPAVALIMMATACSGSGKQSNDEALVNEQSVVNNVDIYGQWYLENIVFSDTEYVRPSEEVPGSRQYILFEDSTYSVMTNCNAMSGPYSIKGDSIWLGDGAITELACDNMATEEALRRILPHITTVDVESDTVVRLNSKIASEYIILRKATEIK